MNLQEPTSKTPGRPHQWKGLKSTWAAAALAVASTLITACGGGDETTATPAPAASMVNTKAAYATGPVTGLGSIIVNGIRYDDSSATVESDDGSTRNASSLKVGMMVELESSSPDRSSGRATASHIRFGSELVGPVSAVDTTNSTVTVLDQVIDITSTTVFDDSLTGGISALTVGRLIEVHAVLDATTGHYVATRVEDKSAATVYRLRGVVASLDTSAKTFKIGSAVISYANVAAADLPANFADGLKVRVLLATTQANGQWVATAVQTGVKRVADFSEASVRGTITAFTSSTAFEVNGLKVDASAAKIEPSAASVVLGAHVQVEGKTVDGVFVATKVEVKAQRSRDTSSLRDVELHGAMSALNTAAKTFVLREITVDYSAVSEWKDGTEANLADGKSIEVHGSWASDGKTLKATKVEFE